jgi:tetratricopeptide (TPR) repeat protein
VVAKTSNPAAIEALFDSAFARHQSGDLEGAERLYRQVLVQNPRHADSLHLLGLVCAQSERLEDAIQLMQQAIAFRPAFDLALFNLGNVFRRLGRWSKAVDSYRQALRFEPNRLGAWVNLGAALRQLGQGDEAIEAYRKAIALKPDHADAHYNLGCVLQQMGRGDEAVGAYRQALALEPGHADALANLATALTTLDRPAEAAAACQRRVALEPTSAEAHRAFSAALLRLGQIQLAVEAATRAVSLQPDDADARIQLGTCLLDQGLYRQAVATYRQAIALAPGRASAFVNLAIALQEGGEAADAKAAITQALALDPTSSSAWAVRSDLKTFTRDDPDLESLTRLRASAQDGRAREDLINLDFTLGKAFMDIGDADQAFAHLAAGAQAYRNGLSYDVETDLAEFRAMARSFDAGRLAKLAGLGDWSDQPLFIVGMPRSGTTLVEQILASHPDIFGGGERPALEQAAMARLGPGLSPLARAQRMAAFTPADLAAMGASYAAGVAALAPGYRRVTDKMPSNFRLIGLIRLILPHARIIHCRRDPLDTCFSCYTRKFSRGQAFTYDLRELGLYYRGYAGLMDHWRAVVPSDRLLEVAYEDVVENLEDEARRLIAFCGLDWDEACLSFHRTTRQVRTASVNQVRQPLYRTSLARWRPYHRYLGPLIEAAGLDVPPSPPPY